MSHWDIINVFTLHRAHRRRAIHHALLYAAKCDNVDVAKYALERKPDTEFTDPTEEEERKRGFTPLLWACFRGCEELVHILIDEGANIDAKSDEGKAPIDYAREQGFGWICDHIQEVKRARFVESYKKKMDRVVLSIVMF